VVCTHALTVLALGAWMRGCRSALLSPFQLRALGLLARIRPTCGLFLGFLEIRSAHRSNASWTCSETGTADCWLSPPPVGSMCRVRGLERAPRGGRYPDDAPKKGPRGLAREPILTTSSLSHHYAYSENRTHRQAPKTS
jgi:hypothetical protein